MTSDTVASDGAPSSRPRWRILAALGLLALTVVPIPATTVLELDFLAIHERAGVIFHGRCISRTEVPGGDPLPFAEYVFEVIEPLKGGRDERGAPVEKLTVRHAGTRKGRPRPDGTVAPPLRLGIPEHEPGEEVILFLTPESKLGLCAPVGLVQGKFQVTRTGDKAVVRNGLGNRGLFARTAPSAFRTLKADAATAIRPDPGDIDLTTFLELCKEAR